MSSKIEESVLDFDLQLLHQTHNNYETVPTPLKAPKDKQRMALFLVKSKIIATDSVLRKYHAARETLDQTQRTLYTSMDECKQICIDQRNTLEKCANLEEDVKTLQKQNQNLEQKAVSLENRCEGLMCHTNQLQVLVKEYETQIEGFKIENKLETTSVKDIEKKYESMKKEKYLLMKDIGTLINVVLEKRKPGHKERILLDKYKKLQKISEKTSGDNVEDDVFDDAMSHSFSDDSMDNNEEVQNGNTNLDSDQINDKGKFNTEYNLLSVDTGRGSSLACSDSEKYYSSPDYLSVDSPTNIFVSKQTKIVETVDIATSPSPEVATVDRAVSPIFRRKEDPLPKIMIDRAVSPTISVQSAGPIFDHNRTGAALTDRPLKLTTRNIATSPIMNLSLNNSLTDSIALRALMSNQKEANVMKADKAVSPLKLITSDKTTSPLMISMHNISPTYSMQSLSPLTFEHIQTNNENVSSDTVIINDKTTNQKIDFHNILTIPNEEPVEIVSKESHKVKILQEKACLELNNSCNVFKQQRNDEEIEMILKEMRLTQELITPLPKTPAISHNSEKRDVSSYSCNESCQEAAKIREENKALNLTVASLVKEVVNIKSLLKTHILTEDNFNNSFQEYNSNNMTTTTDDRLFCDTVAEVSTHNLALLPPNDLCITENVRDATELFKSPHSESIIVSDNIHFEDAAICNDFKIDERQDELIKDTVIVEFIESQSKDKNIKRKKLTKLDKLKKKLIPKQKIQSAQPTPAKILRLKPKKISVHNTKVINCTSSEALNDKVAYEKAVKVMAELNAKKKAFITPSEAKKIEDSSLADNNPADINEITSIELDVSNKIDDDNFVKESFRRSITTRSHRKHDAITGTETVHIEVSENNKTAIIKSKENIVVGVEQRVQQRRGVKRASIDNPDIEMKRILRSSTARKSDIVSVDANKPVNADKNIQSSITKSLQSDLMDSILNNNNVIESKTPAVCRMEQCTKTLQANKLPLNPDNPHDNALCFMIQKYGLSKINNCVKISDNMIDSIAKKIEDGIEKILEMPVSDSKAGMDKVVDDLKKMNIKHFVMGLMKYLNNPTRKVELFNKVCIAPAPPMTKSEQVVLYILTHLQDNWPKVDVVNLILDNIEYALFKLNRTPDFDIIESMAHFYAVLCRYIKARNRLRIFVMDAMYCIQFKSIPLIKQCMDVWMHILPLSHMGIAKAPLVTCLVYLLHFFKCEDKFNRVQEIRHILKQKYFYQVTDWNETKILELFKSAIKDVTENRDEQKMLRMALILLAKRQGPKWCQNNLIRKMLIPFIEKQDVPARVKEFCVSVVGPLLKPYPVEMRVHCEITMNQIMDLLDQSPSTLMQEAIYTSLIYMNKHNPHRVLKALLLWKPTVMSIEMESLLKDFVREKPLKLWKTILSKVPLAPR